MMRNSSIRGFFSFLLAFLVVAGIHAAQPIPKSLEQLSTEAEIVVVGTVGEQEARFNDRQTAILTDTTIEVEETLVGAAGVTLTVTEYGGIVGDRGLSVSGLPRFREGDRVLLFLCRDILGLLRTCGAQQGRLDVRTSLDGTVMAHGLLAGRPLEATLQDLRVRIPTAREGAGR